ncbi:MAG: PD-(D/E)XK nuclease family protein [Candidatus Ratteibacteria bacterium]|nr:PD-(D/E)XK nuclease family protein [Candidatus Ratteibacteria bacterium]
MKKLLIFPFNFRGKTDIAIEEVINKDPSEVLYISPHISKVRDFKLRYYKRSLKGSLLPATHTIKTLALNILDSASDKKIISDVEKYITLLQILKDRKADEQFGHTLPGISLAISHFIKDIKVSIEGTISPEEIKQKICGFEWKFDYNMSLVIFAIDVMKEYIALMESQNLLDMEDIYKEATKYISRLKFNYVLFDSFCEIPSYQRTFIQALIGHIPSAIFSFSYEGKNIPVDVRELILDKTYSWLKKIYQWEEKKFYSEDREPDIECYNFASQSEEVEGIVITIGQALKEHPDWTLNDIITVFPSMPSYRPVVQRIFKRYNIPSEIVPGYSLVQDASISTLLEIFTLKRSYDWTTLMDILFCPNFYNIDHMEAENFSISSRDKFFRIGFIKEDFDRLKSKNISTIKATLKLIEGGHKPLKEWIKSIEEVIEILGWRPCYPEVKVRFQRVLHEMKKNMVVSEEEFINILKKTLELVDSEEGRGAGVRVSGVQEGVGMEKKMCIVGGATAESIPGAPSLEELFIPDTIKRQLGLTDYGLRMARERLDLYRIKNENGKVIFTYPSKIQGRNQMKSIFLFMHKDTIPDTGVLISKPYNIFSPKFSIDKFMKKFVTDGVLNLNVTGLEYLLKCPYRFYLEQVEEVNPYILPQIEETPELWGTIIHRVMDNIFKGYENRTIVEEDITKLIGLFREGVLKEIDRHYREGKISSFYSDVLTTRSEEVGNRFNSIIKKHYGYKFIAGEQKIKEELPSLHLTGKIDRIEMSPSGKTYIVDIKTGTSDPPSYTEKDFFDKFNIQIPLYLWMYCRKNKIDRSDIVGNIWRFDFIEEEDGDKNQHEKVYYDEKLNYLDRIEEFLEETAKKIIRGEYPFVPEDPKSCYFCDYKGMCPYERET